MALGTLEEHYKDLWGTRKFIGNKSEDKLAKQTSKTSKAN